jgi:hypothetical protein
MEIVMKRRIQPTIGAMIVLLLGSSAAARAQGYPTFERNGYPVTPLQLQVLGSESVEEQAPTSTLANEGMPASPHQLNVLRRTNGAAER